MKFFLILYLGILTGFFDINFCQFNKELSFKHLFFKSEEEIESNLKLLNNIDEVKLTYVQKSNIIRVVKYVKIG